MSNSLDTNTVDSFAALETRAAVGNMGIEGSITPPCKRLKANTLRTTRCLIAC